MSRPESMTDSVARGTSPANARVAGLVRVVGFLVCVEIASGILQGLLHPRFGRTSPAISR